VKAATIQKLAQATIFVASLILVTSRISSFPHAVPPAAVPGHDLCIVSQQQIRRF
jgi:hypothetical protein